MTRKFNFEFILGLIILIISFLALIAISSKISFGTSPIFYKHNEVTDNNIDAISLEEIINNFIFK